MILAGEEGRLRLFDFLYEELDNYPLAYIVGGNSLDWARRIYLSQLNRKIDRILDDANW